MKRGTFIVNGVSSEPLKFFIQSRPDIISPKRRITFETAFGRDGRIPFDDEVYDDTETEWSLLLMSNNKTRHENRELLYHMFNSGTYLPLQHYYDEEKIYYGMLRDSITFVNRAYMGEHQVATVPLVIKPYKVYLDSPTIKLTRGQVVTNRTNVKSLPRIKITGNGDCTITVGGRSFVVKNIVGHIWIDSDVEFVYREDTIITNENSKAYTRDYPYLKVGSNEITWTGTFEVQLEPRWRSLV